MLECSLIESQKSGHKLQLELDWFPESWGQWSTLGPQPHMGMHQRWLPFPKERNMEENQEKVPAIVVGLLSIFKRLSKRIVNKTGISNPFL